jgi:hypothetical protein
MVIRAVALAVAGLAIYLLLPSLTRVLASWPRLRTLDQVWLAAGFDTDAAAGALTTFSLLEVGALLALPAAAARR